MKRVLQLSIFLIFSFCAFAQNEKRPESYNYNRGVEAIQNNNTEEGLSYLKKELAEHPDNGYALVWIASVDIRKEDYGSALSNAIKAVKYIPKKDKEYRSFALLARAEIYNRLGQRDKALEDLNLAIKEDPDNYDNYQTRAQQFYEDRNYELANKDYHKMISIDPGNVVAYMGLGRNLQIQELYKESLESFSYVVKLAPEYSSGYSFRADSYFGLKMYREASDDVLKALSIDGDNRAFYCMQSIADSAFNIIKKKLEIQEIKDPNNDYWKYSLGVIHERKQKYRKAIDYFKQSALMDASPITYYRISNCYENMGDFEAALSNIDQAIKLDSTDYTYIQEKADLLYEASRSKEAIALYDQFINNDPEYFGGYYRRGFMKDNTNDTEGAIEDYSTVIMLKPDYAYAYLGRGDMYEKLGKHELAEKDYYKVIELDTIPEDNSCAQYAFFALGELDKAKSYMNRIIEKNPKDGGNYYDAACLYCRMGQKEQSLSYLEKSLEKGYRRFAHLMNDDDLDFIKDLPQFKEMVDKYKSLHESEVDVDDESSKYEETISEIPFTKENGVCKVKCKINGLPLHFIFDTGAYDVSLSNVEATFMMKNEFLKATDVVGKQNFSTASGDVMEGTVINLKNVEFGGLNLTNVKASVVKNQVAPLLLGQTVLSRLGRIEIDNAKQVLRIHYKKLIK